MWVWSPQVPGAVSRPRAACCRIWSIRELDGWAVIWSQQSGINVPIFGWSGILDRKQSNFSLNCIISQFLMSRIFLGNALKRRAPWILREASLNVFTLAADLVQSEGNFTSRPLVPGSLVFIPGFGTKPSRTFQTYRILYLSNLLCWLFILSLPRRSQ